MAERMIIFDANSLLKLMTHYSDGRLPLDGELRSVGVGTILAREIGMDVESKDWGNAPLAPSGLGYRPMYFSYEGKRTMNWTGDPHDPVMWSNENEIEAPKRNG